MADMMTASAARKTGTSPKALQVLKAAKTVFLRDGYEPASMDAIAREGGVSKATLYAHFSSKEKLFAAVIDVECQRHVTMLEQIEAQRLPIALSLGKLGRWFVDFLLQPDVIAVHRMVIAASHRFPELGRLFYEAGPTMVMRMIADFLQRASDRGELNIPDAAIATELFLATVKGNLQFRTELGYPPPGDEERQRIVAAAVDLFMAGYRPA